MKQPGTLALRETGGRLGVPGRQGQEVEEEGHQLPGRAQCTGRGEAASQVHAMHCIISIVFYALYSMYYILCIVFYKLNYSMHCILCIVFYALFSLH